MEDLRVNDSIEPNIYMIGGVNEGGSYKYICDIIHQFPNIIRIMNKSVINSITFKSNDILFIQHLLTGVIPHLRSDITYNLVNELYKKFKVRIVLIVHDFYYILSDKHHVHNSYLSKNIKVDPEYISLFNNAELVIHPSQFTYDIYSNYFSTNNFSVCPHIDFTILDSTLNIPPIKDNVINIGVMHMLSECKGYEYIMYLRENFTKYNGYSVNFIIIGHNVPVYKEDEFFTILATYNIHALACLNKWGETYCYALSKFLKTGLPIIYNNIGSFRTRIPNIDRHIQVFDTETTLDEMSIAKLIDRCGTLVEFIIEHSNTGVYSPRVDDMSVSPPVLYKTLFDFKYKIDPLMVENIVLLSSAIVVSNDPLSYTHIRSAFTSRERLDQTLKNINILRYKIPNVAIVIIEPTLLPQEWKTYLSSIVDVYLDGIDNVDLLQLTNTCLNKGVAECAQLRYAVDNIGQFSNAKNIFKISGRYHLSKSFEIDNFNNDKVCFKLIPPTSVFFEKVPACYTFFFKVPFAQIEAFKNALEATIKTGVDLMASIETILPFEFDKDITTYDTVLGISGYVGPSKFYLDDVI